MFDSIALFPAVLRGTPTTKPAPRFSVTAMFKTALESLVKANSHRFPDNDTTVYRYPPV